MTTSQGGGAWWEEMIQNFLGQYSIHGDGSHDASPWVSLRSPFAAPRHPWWEEDLALAGVGASYMVGSTAIGSSRMNPTSSGSRTARALETRRMTTSQGLGAWWERTQGESLMAMMMMTTRGREGGESRRMAPQLQGFWWERLSETMSLYSSTGLGYSSLGVEVEPLRQKKASAPPRFWWERTGETMKATCLGATTPLTSLATDEEPLPPTAARVEPSTPRPWWDQAERSSDRFTTGGSAGFTPIVHISASSRTATTRTTTARGQTALFSSFDEAAEGDGDDDKMQSLHPPVIDDDSDKLTMTSSWKDSLMTVSTVPNKGLESSSGASTTRGPEDGKKTPPTQQSQQVDSKSSSFVPNERHVKSGMSSSSSSETVVSSSSSSAAASTSLQEERQAPSPMVPSPPRASSAAAPHVTTAAAAPQPAWWEGPRAMAAPNAQQTVAVSSQSRHPTNPTRGPEAKEAPPTQQQQVETRSTSFAPRASSTRAAPHVTAPQSAWWEGPRAMAAPNAQQAVAVSSHSCE